MTDENPLQRAHALSHQAQVISKPPTADLDSLQQALAAYNAAEALFSEAAGSSGDETAKKTLGLLSTQHKKLAKDIERRIGTKAATRLAGPDDEDEPRSFSPGGVAGPSRPTALPRSSSGTLINQSPSTENVEQSQSSGRVVGEPNSGTMPSMPGAFTSNAGLGSRVTPSMGIPPFALRPSNILQSANRPSLSSLSSSPAHVQSHQYSQYQQQPMISPTQQMASTSISGSHTLSPLVSSSSSDESYLNLGATPETLDPFSRFWGMLENMLDDISNPVAFATAPLEIPSRAEPASQVKVEAEPVAQRQRKGSERAKGNVRPSSPSESFYVVPKHETETPRTGQGRETSKNVPTPKTPEELALENISLRATLDALASHAHSLEKSNQKLREQHDKREELMRSAVAGVRREAHKAKHGQDIMRSQLLASVPSPRLVPPSVDKTGESSSSGARRRIQDLEAEVAWLKSDNDKKQAQIDKYKDRFEKIKISAKAKKEARAASVDPGKNFDAKDPG